MKPTKIFSYNKFYSIINSMFKKIYFFKNILENILSAFFYMWLEFRT